MTTQSQYATLPKLGKVAIATANALRDGTGAMGVLLTATGTPMAGTRVDRISINATGDTTTGMLRFFLVRGTAGAPLTSLTFATTVATATTTTPHGLTTGDLVTVQNAFPDQYNVTNVVASVVSATSFTYPMPVAPMANGSNMGSFSVIKAAEVPTLWREIPVTAAVVVARAITSISFVSTTATVTTATAHGLTTGDVAVITGATPAVYNGTYSIVVTGPTTFTYTLASVPATNASVVGSYSVVKTAFSRAMYSQSLLDAAYLPLALPTGWQVRVSTNNAEPFNVATTFTGDTA